MDDEQKKWLQEFARNFGAKEYVRVTCAFGLWTLLWIAIFIALFYVGLNPAPSIFGAMIPISIFVFALIARSWKPASLIFRKFLGNENLPHEPYPRSAVRANHQPRPWWSYLPGLWFSLLTLFVFYLPIRYFLR